jgi:arylsulfatase A-like enzyme
MATYRWTLCLLLLAILPGCGGGPSDWPVTHDLSAGFIGADLWSETRSIDIGTAAGRRQLVSGWTEDRWDARRKRTFVISRGGESVVTVELIQPRPLYLQLFGRPMDTSSGVVIGIDVMVNGYPVHSLEMEKRLRRYQFPVQESVLRPGQNEVALRYRRSDGADPEFEVAWYRMDLSFAEESPPPMPTQVGQNSGVMIPYGTRVEFTMELPATSALTIDRVRHLGDPGGSLSLIVEEDGEEPVEYLLTTGTAEKVAQELSGDRNRIVRLTLRADNENAAASGKSGVIVESVALRSPDAATAAAAEEVAEVADRRSSIERPNILLYVVDTLRADHLGVYGYARPVSPELDKFAATATVFDNAVANSSWTRAAMASMFTGLWPLKHAANGRKDILDPEATTLAEILSAAGYQTAAKVRNWNVFPVFGFRQGFDEYQRVRDGKAVQLTRQVGAWLNERDQKKPFFLWVHAVDPHEPYRPPAETRELFMAEDQENWGLDKHPGFKRTATMTDAEKESVSNYLRSLYDAEIAYNDRGFGELVAILEEQQLLDSTVVIFVSDHGEEFLDHGTWGHGRNLYAENLNVPLIVRFPDRGHGVRVAEVVQQIDLMPTLLDYVGIPVPEHVEGASFLPLLEPGLGSGVSASRPVFSFLHLDGAPTRSLVDGEWKLIQRLNSAGDVTWTGLFNRREDAGEAEDRVLEYPIRTRFMTGMLDAKMLEGSLLSTEEAVLDEETTKALKALGYLQ